MTLITYHKRQGKHKWSTLWGFEKKGGEKVKKNRFFVFDSENIYYAHTESWQADGWSSYKEY
jgi:hypothetical protein